jgi:hypothetical protein
MPKEPDGSFSGLVFVEYKAFIVLQLGRQPNLADHEFG